MSKFLTPQLARLAAGLVVVSAFGAAPMLAQAASTDASGTLSAGAPSNTAPVITPFAPPLPGDTDGSHSCWCVECR